MLFSKSRIKSNYLCSFCFLCVNEILIQLVCNILYYFSINWESCTTFYHLSLLVQFYCVHSAGLDGWLGQSWGDGSHWCYKQTWLYRPGTQETWTLWPGVSVQPARQEGETQWNINIVDSWHVYMDTIIVFTHTKSYFHFDFQEMCFFINIWFVYLKDCMLCSNPTYSMAVYYRCNLHLPGNHKMMACKWHLLYIQYCTHMHTQHNVMHK